jgi:hypothetical protein
MKAKKNWMVGLALMAAVSMPALAEVGKSAGEVSMIKVADWSRVADSAASGREVAVPERMSAPGERRLQARKAEMVRRMFWIMLAHH